MSKTDKSGERAAQQTAQASPAAGGTVKVLVRIERDGVHALGGIFARGAQVRMSREKAEALRDHGLATILGI